MEWSSIGEFSDVGAMEDKMMTNDASCMVNQQLWGVIDPLLVEAVMEGTQSLRKNNSGFRKKII